jgi:hypothetical protein
MWEHWHLTNLRAFTAWQGMCSDWWNESGIGNRRLGENPPQYDFVYHKPNTIWPGIEHGDKLPELRYNGRLCQKNERHQTQKTIFWLLSLPKTKTWPTFESAYMDIVPRAKQALSWPHFVSRKRRYRLFRLRYDDQERSTLSNKRL